MNSSPRCSRNSIPKVVRYEPATYFIRCRARHTSGCTRAAVRVSLAATCRTRREIVVAGGQLETKTVARRAKRFGARLCDTLEASLNNVYSERCSMKRKTVLMGIVLLVASVLAGVPLAQGQESLFGTWTMNAAKSKYSPGPMPKSNIAKWEALQGGVRLTVDVVPAQGETQHYESSGKFDGKDNPVKGNNPDGDTVAFSKVDARTYEVVTKKGGKNTVTARIVVAADGKTRVTTQTGRDGQGRTVNNTMFYEKQ